MSLVVKSFRIEKEIWDAFVAEKQSPSRLIRLFILAGLHQMKIPHYDEILLLTKLEEQARKVGINTNQAVSALNMTLIKKHPLEEKTLRDLQQACRELHAFRNKINKLLAAYYGDWTNISEGYTPNGKAFRCTCTISRPQNKGRRTGIFC